MQRSLQSRESDVSILFADICDSTPLYEESGDARALAVIARRLDELAAIAVRHQGRVIRSKGDDVLCLFGAPTNALDAAAAMVGTGGRGGPAIHVGIHFGPVIRARQDVFGDAVNVAARMLSLAKPGEILASRELVEALPRSERARLASLGRRVLKGKQAPFEIFSMVLDDGDDTLIVWDGGAQTDAPHAATVMASAVVEIAYRGRLVTVRDGDRCLLGRAERCHLLVPDLCVSREHAWIEVRVGSATLTDQSSTGSWILDRDGGHTTLRRETGALPERGVIRLGRHPRDPEPAPELDFTVRQVV